MNNIHEKENQLFKDWTDHYKKFGENEFICFDGLCYNGEIFNSGYNSRPGNEEQLWLNTKNRVLFLTKDTNKNPRQDYREWPWRELDHQHFKMIFAWLYGLSNITESEFPQIENAYTNYDIDNPLCIVNIKKVSGGSSVSNKLLRNYAERDKSLLKRQIVEILNPNIVVCCGGSGSILNIARELIFTNNSFEKKNDWCYYDFGNNILLINSWHPRARISNEKKYNGMMEAVQDFINKDQPSLFK